MGIVNQMCVNSPRCLQFPVDMDARIHRVPLIPAHGQENFYDNQQ